MSRCHPDRPAASLLVRPRRELVNAKEPINSACSAFRYSAKDFGNGFDKNQSVQTEWCMQCDCDIPCGHSLEPTWSATIMPRLSIFSIHKTPNSTIDLEMTAWVRRRSGDATIFPFWIPRSPTYMFSLQITPRDGLGRLGPTWWTTMASSYKPRLFCPPPSWCSDRCTQSCWLVINSLPFSPLDITRALTTNNVWIWWSPTAFGLPKLPNSEPSYSQPLKSNRLMWRN